MAIRPQPPELSYFAEVALTRDGVARTGCQLWGERAVEDHPAGILTKRSRPSLATIPPEAARPPAALPEPQRGCATPANRIQCRRELPPALRGPDPPALSAWTE